MVSQRKTSEQAPPNTTLSGFTRSRLILFSAILTVVIAVGGHFYYQTEISNTRERTQENLQTVAALKAKDISNSITERQADVRSLTRNPFFIESIATHMRSGTSLDGLSQLLRVLEEEYQYERIFLLDILNQEIVCSKAIAPIDAELVDHLRGISSPSNHVSICLYFCESHNEIHLDFVTKIEVTGHQFSMVFRVDPQDHLYEKIQTWPTSSKTAETLIIRKEGQGALFLNELRHQQNTALKLTIPMTETDVPAVQAILGHQGLYIGRDYRGERVVADIRAIVGTDWHLITKIDRREAYADAIYKATIIIISTLFLIITGLLAMFWLYDRNRRNLYQNLYSKEKELAKSQEGFKATLYSIGEAVITTDRAGLLVRMNPVAESLTGRLEADVVGRSLSEIFQIVNEETKEAIDSPVEAVLKLGKMIGLSQEVLLLSKSGKYIPIEISGAPISGEGDLITGVVLVFRDQTQQRKARKLIQLSQQRYQRLFDSSNEGIALHELWRDEKGQISDYRILRVNARFEEYMGLSRQKAEGVLARKLYGESKYLTIYEHVVLTGEPTVFEAHFEFVNRHFRISVFRPDENQFATVFQDITEEKQLLADLEQAKREAEDASNLKSRILSNMSHEIRTPLNGILGFAEILKDDLKSGTNRQMAEVIYSSGSRLLDTLNGIIDLALAESGGHDIKLIAVDLHHVIGETVALFKANADKKGLFIRYTPDSKLPLAKASTDLVAKILNNLINNAIKFTREGEIVVKTVESTQNTQEKVGISVGDTGIGIKPDKLEIIFEEFRQASEGNTRTFDGAGLGLHISQRFAFLMKGSIAVESEWEKGSEFTLWLPKY